MVTVKNIKRPYFITATLALFAISAFLHFWRFPEIPNGFFYDEAAEGYNAYCIAVSGKDEYGIHHPMFFRSFDNYLDPVIVYVLAPMVKIFGLEKWVVRLPGNIFLFLAAIAFFFLAIKYVKNIWICLAGSFVFSVLPWVFPLSRTGIGGYMPMLLGIIGGVYFLVDSLGKKSRISAVLAGVFWAFAIYSHHIGKPMAVVILACVALSFNVLIVRRWKVLAVFLISLATCLSPMIISVLMNPLSVTSRFSQVGVWNGSSGTGETFMRIFERYIQYFSPGFLFISGDSDLRHNTSASGELFVFMLPFVIAGIFFIIRKFRNPYFRFIFYAILSYPATAILTIEKMHSARCMNGAPFWCLLSVIGFYFIWMTKPKFRIPVIAILCFGLIEISSYFAGYFGEYTIKSRSSFVAHFAETVEFSFQNLGKDETLYVSNSVFHHPVNKEFKPVWYIYFLFYGKVDPALYQKAGIPNDYVRPYEGKIDKPGIFIRMNSRISVDSSGYPVAVSNTESIPKKSELIHKIPLSEGSDRFFEIYRINL